MERIRASRVWVDRPMPRVATVVRPTKLMTGNRRDSARTKSRAVFPCGWSVFGQFAFTAAPGAVHLIMPDTVSRPYILSARKRLARTKALLEEIVWSFISFPTLIHALAHPRVPNNFGWPDHQFAACLRAR